MKGKRVGVIMGGVSEESEVSLMTGNAVVAALKERGYEAEPVMADGDIVDNIKKSNCDLAFVALHGPMGEDGAVQGLLQWLGVPYVGTGVLGSAIAMNKVVAKELFAYHGVPTARFRAVLRRDSSGIEEAKDRLTLPCVVKPASQGSTIGLTVVRDPIDFEGALDRAFQYDDELLIEEFIDGRLLAVGIIGEAVLPIVEIKPRDGLYDYEAKYTKGKTDYLLPAPLSLKIAESCGEAAMRAHRALRCKGVSRVDIILDSREDPIVLEVNTIPGMTETSLLPMAAAEAGMGLGEMLEKILETANNVH